MSNKIVIVILLSLLCVACGSDNKKEQPLPEIDKSYLTSPENKLRDWLSYDELNAQKVSKKSPYHNDYFMPIGQENPALHVFNGTLTIAGNRLDGFPNNYYETMKRFPNLTVQFVSHDGYLIPANRDIIVPDDQQSFWRVILSPGKVWSETTDNGMSRASFPFVLVETGWNTTLNGLATFLYDDNQVSSLRVQIVQHTAPGFRDEAAGTLGLSYHTTPDQDNSTLTQKFDVELQQRLPIANWQSLIDQFPLLNWPHFNSGLADNDISASAIWFQEKIYMQPCHTLYGEYPFCRFMRHGVYSATKPAAGAVALTYLVQRYGSEVLNYFIKDYVEVTADHNGWDQVRFVDALNMVTGIGNNDHDPNSTNTSPDEHGSLVGDWSRALSEQEKLDIAFQRYGNYPWGPNEVFRYNTNHYFILSAAIDNLVRQREGIGLWQLLKDNVYQPIGIQHSPMMHTTESDGSRGVPILGIGLYPTVDDMIKIGRLLHQNGQFNGAQLLHAETLNKALFRTTEHGFFSHWHDNQDGKGRYLLSFFSVPYLGESGCLIQVPLLSGSGGNLVTILPNGVISLRFADAKNYDARAMIDISGALAPVCQ
ncbi:MAG: hypothetical protein HRT52_00735 [Colwellia sp.]|nr:hypothetical protein [Colwellia sp.]